MSDRLILTPENYHSREMNLAYLSVSQYKSWLKCEAATLAELQGTWEPEDREALLVGQYVHCFSEGTLEEFKKNHADIIYNKKGEPYAPYKRADEMIATLESDPKVMFYLQGEKEVILQVGLFGVAWKFKIDVLNPELNYLLELKTAANFDGDWVRQDGKNVKVSFIEAWDYMTQAALFAEGERIFRGGDGWRDFFMVAVTKQDPPDKELINLTDAPRFQLELDKVQENLPRIIQVKNGIEPPRGCGTCKYCRATKKIDRVKFYSEFIPA